VNIFSLNTSFTLKIKRGPCGSCVVEALGLFIGSFWWWTLFVITFSFSFVFVVKARVSCEASAELLFSKHLHCDRVTHIFCFRLAVVMICCEKGLLGIWEHIFYPLFWVMIYCWFCRARDYILLYDWGFVVFTLSLLSSLMRLPSKIPSGQTFAHFVQKDMNPCVGAKQGGREFLLPILYSGLCPRWRMPCKIPWASVGERGICTQLERKLCS
jgi:hypothetical protein